MRPEAGLRGGVWQSPPQVSSELRRILALPRRDWTDEATATVVETLTKLLRRDDGTMTLLPDQARALYELAQCRGGFFPLVAGGGKTLLSLLAFTVLGSVRPLLLVPAKLREKTRRAWRLLAEHWRIPRNIRIESFEVMGRVGSATLLETYAPDAIVADEAHKARNHSAAVTKRLTRYLDHHTSCAFVAMSGTLMKRSLRDFAHLARWALRAGAPVPLAFQDLVSWANVIDEQGYDDMGEASIGALSCFGTTQETVRRGFNDRMVATRGVIASTASGFDRPIVIERLAPEVPDDVATLLADMRATWCTPDGHPFEDALSLWRHCRELATGFWLRWDPLPPPEWLRRRKDWSAICRHLKETNRSGYDSHLAVEQAIDAGRFPEAAGVLARWREIKDSFKIHTVPVWVSDFVIDELDGAAGKGALLWCENPAFGQRASELLGLPYYGAQGLDARGKSVMDHDPRVSGSALVSRRSVGEGFDLERFSRNVIASPPTGGDEWEQLLARTHRRGQTADEVSATVVVTCDEHERALRQALRDARAIEDAMGQPQRLLLADFTFDLDTAD